MLLTSPDPRAKIVTIAGETFRRHRSGYFELPNVDAVVLPLLEAGWTEFIPKPVEETVAVPDKVKMAEFHAVVIRCGCGDPASHAGQVCPKPKQLENLGKVASYYRNPITRILKRIERFFQKGN